MKRFYIFLGISFTCGAIQAQPTQYPDPFWQFTDFHIHPTYKHYFRPKSADQMKRIRESTHYDSERDTIFFTKTVVDSVRLENDNWERGKEDLHTLQRGLPSDLLNYDQSAYPQIMHAPGSILCNSYSPYEKQFAFKKIKRLISSKIVTRMGLPRLKSYSEDDHSPLRDFLSEYYYNLMQEDCKLVYTSIPNPFFLPGEPTYKVVKYYNTIKMVRNGKELREIIDYNDRIFKLRPDSQTVLHIVTPMVMSIEGAQVLYDVISAREENIMHPLCNGKCVKKNSNDFVSKHEDWKLIRDELLKSVDSLKNLHHRLFFITLGHFAQNHIVGFAKTLDRDPENFQHRAMAGLTTIPKVRNDVIHKTYSGFNERFDGIGLKVVEAFLDTTNTRFRKPTLIDVKHMDIRARIQYYYFRRKYEADHNVKIPIIASHFAISGEKQAMAAATGLWPNFDRYIETERTESYYKSHILRINKRKSRKYYWETGVMKGSMYRSKEMDATGIGIYKPLNFLDPTVFDGVVHDPFINYNLDADSSIGWFYPWSINLFDEEIIEINKSRGIIGILLDPRQLGAFMPRYKKIEKDIDISFQKEFEKLQESDLKAFGLTKADISAGEYCKSEPLLRNLFYIDRLIRCQKAAEEKYKLDKVKLYDWFVPDTAYTKTSAWEFISIGSDYDGLIDPIDFSPTAAYIPMMHRKMIVYAFLFSRIRYIEFHDPVTKDHFITDLNDSAQKMKQFFFENGKNFILRNF